jgi:heat shock protein HslJ
MVPFVALTVQVCRYPIGVDVIGKVLTSPSVVARIENETNRFPILPTVKGPSHPVPACRSRSGSDYFVTFVNGSQRVDVTADGCGTASNGVRSVRPTATWLNELQRYTPIAIVGTWRPISVTGYHGPLTDPPLTEAPMLRLDNRGEWTGNDSCNDFGGSYQLRSGGTFHLVERVTTKVLCRRSTPGPPTTAVRAELLNGRLTFFGRDGHELAQYQRANVTARIVLRSTTMTGGSSMSGHVIVDNNTGHVLHVAGCGSLFAVALGNAKIKPNPAFASCRQIVTIPIRQSSYTVTVRATYLGCGGTPLGDNPACVTTNGHTALPRLPPGEYDATLFQSSNVVQTPPPIAVRVTPQRSAK